MDVLDQPHGPCEVKVHPVLPASERCFGRNINRLVSRFIQAEKGIRGGDHSTESPCVPDTPFAGVISSPEIKRRREMQRLEPSASISTHATGPEAARFSTANATAAPEGNDHVLRFRNTLAIFEKMGEQQGPTKDLSPKPVTKKFGRSSSESPSFQRHSTASSSCDHRQSLSPTPSDPGRTLSASISKTSPESFSSTPDAMDCRLPLATGEGVRSHKSSTSESSDKDSTSQVVSPSSSTSVNEKTVKTKPSRYPPVPAKPNRFLRTASESGRPQDKGNPNESQTPRPVGSDPEKCSSSLPRPCDLPGEIRRDPGPVDAAGGACGGEFLPDVRESEDQIGDVVLRRNRYNLSKSGESSGVLGAGRGCGVGVLLPKRRSRDEKSLSKEDIEASLNEADSYWRRTYGESLHDGMESKMSESTYSSGSGEEMARSDSNHELTSAPPLSPSDAGNSGWSRKFLGQKPTNGLLTGLHAPLAKDPMHSSETDSESCPTLQGSVVDCDFKDCDTEKPPPTSPPSDSTTTTTKEPPPPPSTSSLPVGSETTARLRSVAVDPSHRRLSAEFECEGKRLSAALDHDTLDRLGSASSLSCSVRNSACSSDGQSSDSASTVILSQSVVTDDDLAEVAEAVPVGGKEDAVLSGSSSSEDAEEDVDYVAIGGIKASVPGSLPLGGGAIPSDLERPSSPAESVDSMTPSEQEAFLCKEMEDDDIFCEDRRNLENAVLLDEEASGLRHVHTDADDGLLFYEIEGLPDENDEDEEEEMLSPSVVSCEKLRKVKFSVKPIRVFITYSMEEYDRRNEDVDPMAASAEYELEKRVEKMDLHEVELVKGPDGLGISIIGMGVGADSGLEKLGIFIKTLTEGGAAQRDGRIQVNDQIIEVDGKSLVGVTQAYAASVLRNTSGDIRFVLGREKDASKSEVARLIQMSIEQDKKRNEIRRQELEERQRWMEEQLKQQQLMEQERLRQGTRPQSMEADGNNGSETSTGRFLNTGENVGVRGEAAYVDLDESSSETTTPELDAQVLFVKLKEAQYKNAVSEAELAKLKAKMILCENAESQRKVMEKKCEDMALRLRDSDRALQTMQKEVNRYQDLIDESQNQYIEREKRLASNYAQVEKKYHKAKKLIKEYQHREQEYLEEQDATYQQQVETLRQYDELIRILKDRIFHLEKFLAEAYEAAGLPNVIPHDAASDKIGLSSVSILLLKPKPFPVIDTEGLEVSSESEASSPEFSSEKEKSSDGVDGRKSSTVSTDLSVVPSTELLNVSANKSKSQLSSLGSIATRRPPTRHSSMSLDLDDVEEEEGGRAEEDGAEDDEPFVQHDSEGTVRKNTTYKTSPVSESLPSGDALKSTSGTVGLSASAKKPLHVITESGSLPSSDPKTGYLSEERIGEQVTRKLRSEPKGEGVSSKTTSVLSRKGKMDSERVILEKKGEDPSVSTHNVETERKASEVLPDVVSGTESGEVTSLQVASEFPESKETQNPIVTDSSPPNTSQAIHGENKEITATVNTNTSFASDMKSENKEEPGQIGSGEPDNCVVAHGGNERVSVVSGRRAARTVVKGASDAASLHLSFQEEMKQALIRRKAILAQQMGPEESEGPDAGVQGDRGGGTGVEGAEDVDPSQQPHYENWLFEVTQGAERRDKPEVGATPLSSTIPGKTAAEETAEAVSASTKRLEDDSPSKPGVDVSTTSKHETGKKSSAVEIRVEAVGAATKRPEDESPSKHGVDTSTKSKHEIAATLSKIFGGLSSPIRSRGGPSLAENDGVSLISKKALPTDFAPTETVASVHNPHSNENGKPPLLASEKSDPGYLSDPLTDDLQSPNPLGSSDDFSVSSTEASPNTTFRYSLMSQWTPVQVSQWLEKQELGQYAQQFLEKGVNGQQLLQLDSTKMKLYGIIASKDRDLLKKKLKDVRAALERERRQDEREQKMKERLARQSPTSAGVAKKKKFFSK